MPRTGQPAIRHVAAVQRAVAVLDALAGSGDAERAGTAGTLGTNEIARRTGINPSTVSRLLATLVDAGLVEHVAGTGRYRLGIRLLQLGNAVLSQLDLREIAKPHLTALTEATGETSTLSAPGEREAVTVDYVQSPSYVRSVAQIGRPSVAHATAVGKVFLAWGGRLPEGTLPAYTARTIVDRDSLTSQIQEVRSRGWARATGEREAELSALAAPVLDARGDLIAILGVQGPSARFDARATRNALPLLLEHAAAISSALGYREPPTEEEAR